MFKRSFSNFSIITGFLLCAGFLFISVFWFSSPDGYDEKKMVRDFEDVFYESYALLSDYDAKTIKGRLLAALDSKDSDARINDWISSMQELVTDELLKELIENYLPDKKAYDNGFMKVSTNHQTIIQKNNMYELSYYVNYISDNGYLKFFQVDLKFKDGKINDIIGSLVLGDDF